MTIIKNIKITPECMASIIEVLIIFIIIFYFLFQSILKTSIHQEFVYQADGFLRSSVFYNTLPPYLLDSSLGLNGHWYWPLGPFPTVLLMPFVAMFGLEMIQQYIHWIIIALTFWLSYKLARQFIFSKIDSLLLSTGLILGSVYFGIVFSGGAVWQFATAISTVLVLATLDEHFNRRRYWLMGLYLACAFATRFTAGLAVIYVIIDTLVTTTVPIKLRFKQLVKLLTPIILVGISLLWLNYARTGSMLDNGYKVSVLRKDNYQYVNRERYGLFSLENIPTNIYYYFMIPPKPVIDPDSRHLMPPYFTMDIGLGFFYISPIFLLIFRSAWRKREQILAGITAGTILFILLTYYAINDHQFGTYYLADILPFLYLLLLYSFTNRKIGLIGRVLVYSSILFNYYLLLAFRIN